MFVVKRDGRRQPVAFDKITSRIRHLCAGLDQRFVDPVKVAQKVVQGIYSGVTVQELDKLAAETSAYMSIEHPDYGKLASRLVVSDLHKDTAPNFAETMVSVHEHIEAATGLPSNYLDEEILEVIKTNAAAIEGEIDYSRDYSFDYFGIKTLMRAYLLKIEDRVVERPQHMFMRVALGIHGADLVKAFETYHLMADKWFIHASPTLFHAATARPQLSSCFLLTLTHDSITGIYDTLQRCADISKSAGGIGISVHNIRASGSYIRGTKGTSNGLVPMLRVFDATARYVDQGGGKRPGAFAVYLEPWHADIFEVLDLRKNHGKEELRARSLFYALWVPDLLMKRVEENGDWSLLCPDECPGLADCYGAEFEALYCKYEREGKAKRVVKAQELWFAILEAQMETGMPFMLFKDACNAKSNQKHLGTIKSSNLCTEILEYSSPDEVAVCNLASIVLSKFVRHTPSSISAAPYQASYKAPDDEGAPGGGNDAEPYFDMENLYRVTKVVARNLNKVIDRNWYPVPEARNSNMRHRPMGIGVQGLADTFILLRLPFDSEKARALNRDMFETMYFAAMEASVELAETEGPHESFPGSPLSEGLFQFDLWGVSADELSGRYDWEALRKRVMTSGVRNSLLLAPMPTASTAQILGSNECIEPYTTNLYSRRVSAGEFIVVNPHLLQDLISRGLWTDAVRNQLMADGGSVAGISDLPDDVKEIYRTVWEIKQRPLIDMAADRGIFIDQSQSLNAFVESPDNAKLTSLHFHSWRRGLKTGMYYLRTKPAVNAIQFTVDQRQKPSDRAGTVKTDDTATTCTDEVCLSCQ